MANRLGTPSRLLLKTHGGHPAWRGTPPPWILGTTPKNLGLLKVFPQNYPSPCQNPYHPPTHPFPSSRGSFEAWHWLRAPKARKPQAGFWVRQPLVPAPFVGGCLPLNDFMGHRIKCFAFWTCALLPEVEVDFCRLGVKPPPKQPGRCRLGCRILCTRPDQRKFKEWLACPGSSSGKPWGGLWENFHLIILF